MTPELRRTLRLRYLMAEIEATEARDWLCRKSKGDHDEDAWMAFDLSRFNLQQAREDMLDGCE